MENKHSKFAKKRLIYARHIVSLFLEVLKNIRLRGKLNIQSKINDFDGYFAQFLMRVISYGFRVNLKNARSLSSERVEHNSILIVRFRLFKLKSV